MKHLKILKLAVFSLLFICTSLFASGKASAKTKENALIENFLKDTYQAKRKRIPFMGMARFAVKIARPAGVKSFDIMFFEKLSSPNGRSSCEPALSIQQALGHEWQTLVRVHERNGEQTFIYAKDKGKTLELFIVNMERDEAAVVRVKLDPTTLAKWLDNPKLLGISLRG